MIAKRLLTQSGAVLAGSLMLGFATFTRFLLSHAGWLVNNVYCAWAPQKLLKQ